MPTIDSYDAKTMSVNFSWLPELTGLERIMLSAPGDLQRLLSAFFDLPITVSLIYSNNTLSASQNRTPTPLSHPQAAVIHVSRESMVIQTRQVNLLCASQIVCTATSTVRISSPECARLFIAEKYAIGQVFRELERPPRFELIAVGVGRNVAGEDGKVPQCHGMKQQLWRKYTLYTDGFECEILEVFPTREMFVRGNRWLDGQLLGKKALQNRPSLDVLSGAMQPTIKVILVAMFLLVAMFSGCLFLAFCLTLQGLA